MNATGTGASGEFAVRRADLSQSVDCNALLALLDMYARDPMGGSTPLSQDTHQRLCNDLLAHPKAVSFLAHARSGEPIGLANCFEGYSTFKAQPLLNVHDIAVVPAWRSRGVGQALLTAAQEEAISRGCCKLTLEVLSGNERATRSYVRFGFANYELDPAAGHALLMQKWL